MPLKFVLITGCSAGGIGHALAHAFQKRNVHVFATARDTSKMSSLEELPHMTLLSMDPTSAASVQAAYETVRARTEGKLDYLVNNAGQTVIMPTLDFDIEAAKEMFEINVWGLIRTTQVFAPLLVAAQGTIVNISSISTVVHTPYMGLYAGSKCAVTMISDTLGLELAPFHVKVLTVITGAVKTNTLDATSKSFSLPQNSLYKEIEEIIAARARGEDGTPRMDPSTYAESVVSDILNGKSGQTWRGAYAGFAKVMRDWFPSRLIDTVSQRGTGLDTWKR